MSSLGIIGEVLGGAIGGAGKGLATGAEEDWKNQLEQQKAEKLAALARESYKANAQTDIDLTPAKQAAALPGQLAQKQGEADIELGKARRMPYSETPGGTRVVPGAPGEEDQTFTAPIRMTDEQRGYYAAHAREADARARKAESEAKALDEGRSRQNDPASRPKIMPLKNSDGEFIGYYDENSGAIGTVTPPKPGTPAEKGGFFSSDKPGTDPVPANVSWRLQDKPVQLDQLYPKIQSRMAPGRADAESSDVQNDILKAARGDNASPTQKADKPQAADKPPAAYPEARKSPLDGKWYVKRGSSYYLVQ